MGNQSPLVTDWVESKLVPVTTSEPLTGSVRDWYQKSWKDSFVFTYSYAGGDYQKTEYPFEIYKKQIYNAQQQVVASSFVKLPPEIIKAVGTNKTFYIEVSKGGTWHQWHSIAHPPGFLLIPQPRTKGLPGIPFQLIPRP
jgi:hypothetical protein